MLLPDAFAVYGAYVATLTWFGSVGCLRLQEQAIVLPETDDEASTVTWIAIFSSILVALVTLVFVMTHSGPHATFMGVPELAKLLPLLPLGLFALGVTNAFNYRALRQHLYRPIMNSSVAQGVGSVLGQVGLALRGLTGSSLREGGDVVGRLAAVGPYLFMGQITAGLRGNDIASFRRLATRYSTIPADLSSFIIGEQRRTDSSRAADHRPLWPSGWRGGFFYASAATRRGPDRLIGAAVSQVYVAQLGGMLRIGDLAAMRRLFRRYTGTLLKFGAPPILVLRAVSPWLFARLLGPRWGSGREDDESPRSTPVGLFRGVSPVPDA